MKKTKRFRFRSIVITAALSVVITLGAVALAAWWLLGSVGLTIAAGAAYINTLFVGNYDQNAMADAALETMVDALGDRWSYYMDAESYEASKLRRNNVYVGIGVTVYYETDGLRIQEVAEGGPAAQAGLLAGEIITAADGHDLTGENANSTNSAAYIQGEEGTQVVLTVTGTDGIVRQVTVTRKRIESDPVTSELLEDGVGYIALDNFYRGSAEYVEAAVEDLLEQGATSLLFDVRNNPGGYLEELIDLLDYLLPEGVIFQSGDSSGPDHVTQSDAGCVDVPMAVLVNENSYSAAELFAAQLRESVGAAIIGQPTCGKGYSQQTFILPNGGALNISTRTYYTGSGQSLIGVGITPDIQVELIGPEDDQLNAAVAALTE